MDKKETQHLPHIKITDEDVLNFHTQGGRPGKIEIRSTKPLETQQDLSLAYTPGVAVPVNLIAKNPEKVYDYTAKGNFVAIVTNGTAILGLGNLGALASKPVMEGKAALFKRFVDIDAIDIEVDAQDPETVINVVRHLGSSFGAINLEDIKAPDCFIVEKKLQELMDIPVFHDDQHGTAIIMLAGLINALEVTAQKIEDVRIVVNGAGAAAIALLELLEEGNFHPKEVILCDTKGTVYEGRQDGMNPWKIRYAAKTSKRTLKEAIEGANVFIGVSAKGAVTRDMVASMAKNPIIFALANPDPEIFPEDVAAVRSDAIMATGRSDYPNQINNSLCYPYIFRGALDVRAKVINTEMKVACAYALAKLARSEVPDEVTVAYNRYPYFGPDYIIPLPFDPRLLCEIPLAVARAASQTGVARLPLKNAQEEDDYQKRLSRRLSPKSSLLYGLSSRLRNNTKRVVFAEGEEEYVIRAALKFIDMGFGQSIVVGAEDQVQEKLVKMGHGHRKDLIIENARINKKVQTYVESLYLKLQRQGYLMRDCLRLVQMDRNVFAASILAHKDADLLVTGLTRHYSVALSDVLKTIDPIKNGCLMGLHVVMTQGRSLFIADTSVHENPTSQQLALIAIQSAKIAKKFGFKPHVAFLSHSTFGNPMNEISNTIAEAMAILGRQHVDFDYDGEMEANIALEEGLRNQYPFCRLEHGANVLVMPNVHAASIATDLLRSTSRATIIGPLLVGLSRRVQILKMNANPTDILNLATLGLS